MACVASCLGIVLYISAWSICCMIVCAALCSAMLRRFQIVLCTSAFVMQFFGACLWCDTNSFRACSLSTTLSVIRVYMYILIMCVSVLLCMAWGLQVGLCWLCTVTSTFEWGMDTYACTLVCDLCLLCAIRWPLSGRSLSWFLRVWCLLLFPTVSRWLPALYSYDRLMSISVSM